MWRIRRSLQALLAAIMLGCLLVVQLTPIHVGAADIPSLTISQLKITSANGQFITLYNATDTALDMSKYQLEYFNNYDLSKSTSSKLIALSGFVPPHGYFMINDGTMLLCYQLTVDSTSLGLSSTAGLVEVLAFNQGAPGGSVNPVLQDYVGWSKAAAPGAQTLPAATGGFLQRQSISPKSGPFVSTPGSGSWMSVQPDSTDPCVIVGSGGASVQIGMGQLLASAEPPATIAEPVSGSTAAGPSMPAADVGLMAPAITELLPNPAGIGNDSSDEFIELYNPNTVNFDLSGFSLQSGITSLHTFMFPAGTMLTPQAFKAFYSKTTGLSLSNTSGQVKLLDPFGNSVAAAEPYGAAADGQAWSLAKGKWYWTTTPTPDKANTIHQPPAKKSASKSVSSKSKGANTTGSSRVTATTGNGSSKDPVLSPIHMRTLALVAGAALLYGAYEYRSDLANRVHQFRRQFGDRYADRT